MTLSQISRLVIILFSKTYNSILVKTSFNHSDLKILLAIINLMGSSIIKTEQISNKNQCSYKRGELAHKL